MVPDKFNMVDMGGIDLIMMQGEEVPGLYNRLVESIAQCRYQCLYNWLFDGVIIPPTYVELEVNENDEVAINEGVTVSPDDVIHIYSVSPPVDPEIIPLLAEENGVYNVPAGKDGFNPVTVDVPSYIPVISSITITENGAYYVPEGVDGFNPVNVEVPVPMLYTNMELSARGLYTFQTAGERLCTANSRGYYKTTNDVAYGCYPRPGGGTPFLISTIADAVKYRADSGGPFAYTSTFEYDGVTWYVSSTDHGWGGNPENTLGPLLNFNFSQTSSRPDMGLEFLQFVLTLPVQPTQFYKPDSSGFIFPPEGYSGFGPLLLD